MEGKWTLDAMSMRKDLYGWCGQIFVLQQTARRFPQSPGQGGRLRHHLFSSPRREYGRDGLCPESCAIPVPSDCEDDERLGTLIEALAVDTCDNIPDVYIHRSVIGKDLRDEQSAELLLRFITVRAFDLCYAFNVKNPMDAFVIGVSTGNYASAQKRSEKAYIKSIQKTVEALRGKD